MSLLTVPAPTGHARVTKPSFFLVGTNVLVFQQHQTYASIMITDMYIIGNI
jgi:hypothetical protein